MEQAIERVMQAYTMMQTLSPAEGAEALAKVRAHLAGLDGDENVLAVAGLRFLRGNKQARKRRSPADQVV